MPRNTESVFSIEDAPAFRANLTRWYAKHARDLPWRRTRDPYAIWVSEIMLQQTQVVTVQAYFERWMKRFPDFTALAGASGADVLQIWQGLGYYSRARNMHLAAQIVIRDHGGKMPRHPDEIRMLPGIGRYTAGAIATFAFDTPAPIIDANIARVLARLLNMRTPIDSTLGQAILWARANVLQPHRFAGRYNSALMELGALICVPRTPKCPACPVNKFCLATNPGALPVKKPRRKTVRMTEQSAWIVKTGRILLEQQTGSRWRGLWKLPAYNCRLAIPVGSSHPPLLEFTYPFTHHLVTLTIFPQRTPKRIDEHQHWFELKELLQIAITAPHRRAIEQLLKKKN